MSVRKACKKSQRCCSHGGGRQQAWVARQDALARRAVSLFHFLSLHSILMAPCLLALFFVALSHIDQAWPWTPHGAEDNFEILILLPPLHKCFKIFRFSDYSHLAEVTPTQEILLIQNLNKNTALTMVFLLHILPTAGLWAAFRMFFVFNFSIYKMEMFSG